MHTFTDAPPRAADGLLDEVARYYDAKLAEFGATPRGVDWNSAASQWARFDALARLLPAEASYSVNDLGCGYGAFVEFLQGRGDDFTYTGIDIAEGMVAAARARHADVPGARFVVGDAPEGPADFGVTSGIFNVKQGRPDSEWEAYVHGTLDTLAATSTRGFAFNCLTSHSDPERMRAELFYADPAALFDRCMRRYSRQVALLHDYGLFEFTIVVRFDS